MDKVKEHLTNNVDGMDFEPNKVMLDKINEMLSNGQELTGAYKEFYNHELTELGLMNQGYSYTDAHNMALEIHNVPPQALYPPEIIQSMPEWFNINDFNFWGIKR